MTESIHGHDVMRMMVEANRPFTEGQLKEAIAVKFGAEARFHTCSASKMTAEDLIGFLRERSKFIVADDTVAMKPENICDHE